MQAVRRLDTAVAEDIEQAPSPSASRRIQDHLNRAVANGGHSRAVDSPPAAAVARRLAVAARLSRPGDLQGPSAYGVRIRGDSMLPAHWPAMVAIVSPGCLVRDGDQVYAHLVSGERLVRVVHPVTGGFVLAPYNPAYAARWVEKAEVEALHVIVYSRRREVLTDDIERVAVERDERQPATGGASSGDESGASRDGGGGVPGLPCAVRGRCAIAAAGDVSGLWGRRPRPCGHRGSGGAAPATVCSRSSWTPAAASARRRRRPRLMRHSVSGSLFGTVEYPVPAHRPRRIARSTSTSG